MCDSWPDSGSRTTPSRSRRDRARTNSSRASFRRSADASTPRSTRGSGSSQTLQRAQRRLDEELAADERRHRVSRQPEHERRAADAERDRLPRLDRDAPEHLLDAELGLDLPHEIVRPDRDAARRDEDVRREPALRAPPGAPTRRRRPTGSSSMSAPDGGERGREHEPVRLVDLAGRRAGRPTATSSLPVASSATRGRRAHATVGDAGGRERTELRGPEPHAGRNDDVARRNVAATRTNMRATAALLRAISIVLSRWTTYSRGTTASAPSGTTPPVEISIASPGRERRAGRAAGRRDGSTTARRPGASAARTANPSIAELGNGGRSTTRDGRLRHVTRPAAAATGTGSPPSGRARASTSACASSIVRNGATSSA